MAFGSAVYDAEPIIDDSMAVPYMPGMSTGLVLPPDRDKMSYETAYQGVAEPFPTDLIIPEADWEGMIKEQEEKGERLSDMILRAGIPSKDQDSLSYCVPPGTLIRMADGTNKPIERISLLDKVLTAEGHTGRVLKTIVHDVSEPLYVLKVWGHNHLRATSEHPILTKRGYVPISKIKIGDKVAFPRYAPGTTTMLMPGDYLYEKNTAPQSKHKYRNGAPCRGSSYRASIPGKTAVTISIHAVPDAIHLTPDLGRVFGLYLAEGHTSSGAVYFSFNANEKDTLAAECAAKIRTSLGCEPHVRIRKTVCQVTIHGAAWAKLFDALFARGSASKRLCPELTSGPKEFLAEILSGWMDGDRKKGNSGVTVSRQLALNMFDIANAAGLMPVFGTHQNPKVGTDGRQRLHSWIVGWANTGRINHGTEQDETHLWRTVRGLEQDEYSGPVFNIEVEGDNSYVAEGIGVHNCWIFGPTGCMEVVRTCLQNEVYVPLSATSAGAVIKNFRNQGGWGKEGLQYIANKGVCTQADWPECQLKQQYNTPAAWENAKNYMAAEWWVLNEKSFNQIISCLLRRIPVAVGLAWWSHEIFFCDPIWLDGRIAIRFRNSWGDSYGSKGFGILQGSKMYPDDAVAPRVSGRAA